MTFPYRTCGVLECWILEWRTRKELLKTMGSIVFPKRKKIQMKTGSSATSTQESGENLIDKTNAKILSAINSLKESISHQTRKMTEHDKYFAEQNSKLKCSADRLDSYEESYEYENECYKEDVGEMDQQSLE